MKEYRLNPSKVSAYVKRVDNKIFKTILITIIAGVFLIPFSMREVMNAKIIAVLGTSFLFSAVMIGLIYWNNKKLTRLRAENLIIIVDEESITCKIDLENEPRMNFLHRYGYEKAKNVSGVFYARIEFDQLKSFDSKNGDLLIKAMNSNPLNGKNILTVPQELEGFSEVEEIVKSKMK